MCPNSEIKSLVYVVDGYSLCRIITTLLLAMSSYLGYAQDSKFTLISWNIRDFGNSKDSVEIEHIAEVLRNADVVSIQEVVAGSGGSKAVARLADDLNRKGAKWEYQISNPTGSPKGAKERYALLWKTSRFKKRGKGRLLKELDAQIFREPFLMTLYTNNRKISILSFHARPKKEAAPEIEVLSEYLKNQKDLIVVGDFNLNYSSNSFQAFRKRCFNAVIDDQKTTIKKSCKNGNYLLNSFDNIIYPWDMNVYKCGTIDYIESCDNVKTANKLSDHLPVMMQFSIPN